MKNVEDLFITINTNLKETKQKCDIIIEDIISENEFFKKKVKEYSEKFEFVVVNALKRVKNLNYLYPILEIDSKDEESITTLSKFKPKIYFKF
jgi:hypothetical protein